MRIKPSIAIISTSLLATLPLVAVAATVNLDDPLSLQGNPFELYGRLIRGFTGLVGAVALFFFVLGGMKILTSGGKEEKIKSGKDTLMWATIGMAVILGSYFILSYIINILTGTTGATTG